MKWFSYKHGDIRIRKKFIWIPLQIENEVHWLESIYVKEQFHKGQHWTGWKTVETKYDVKEIVKK